MSKHGEIEVRGLRGAILAKITDNFTATLRGDFSRTRTADYLKAVNIDGYTYATSAAAKAQFIADPRKVYNNVQGRALHKDRGGNITLHYDAPFGDITSITSYRDFR